MTHHRKIGTLRLLALATAFAGVVLLHQPARADQGCQCDTCRRAGCWHCCPGYPPRVGIVSAPSNTWRYGGYYVGGGTVFRGEPRCVNEGTWGWDYGGLLSWKRIALNWSHGRRYQAGGGTYRTAGPAPLPSQ